MSEKKKKKSRVGSLFYVMQIKYYMEILPVIINENNRLYMVHFA